MAGEAKRHRILSHAEEKMLLPACQGIRTIEYERGGKKIEAEIQYEEVYIFFPNSLLYDFLNVMDIVVIAVDRCN